MYTLATTDQVGSFPCYIHANNDRQASTCSQLNMKDVAGVVDTSTHEYAKFVENIVGKNRELIVTIKGGRLRNVLMNGRESHLI